ncbi:MAG: AAA family ATPase [Verrucomicrobiae bacterium]|nr:AAA family ATPase [Verrucomicrobiae bacterium]NNJ42130.1 AAA family ATPase [Akkermansiaceae bacterium]
MSPQPPEDGFLRGNLTETLDQLAKELATWLHSQLFRHAGKNWWENNVCSILQGDQLQRIEEEQWVEIEDLDLYGLLKVLMGNFRFLKARRALDNDSREIIRGMRHARNRCMGHRPVSGVPLEEIEQHIISMQKFCRLIGCSKILTGSITALSDKIKNPPTVISKLAPITVIPKQAPPLPDEDGTKLADFYGDDGLTPSQEAAVQSLQTFLDSPDDRCFILNGYAGTGKTFLIGGLVRYLNHKHRTASMMAPTGRAAHVLRERHQIDASTIHRHIYSMKSLKEYKEIDENGDITYKFYFETKNNDTEHDTVFIVDEASMISDMHSESEFMHFGSGRLLSDLIEYINFDANDYRKKLILVGDGAQLPPVGMNSSPALNPDYLKDKCHIVSTACELTDVVRQNEASPILKNATQIRELLREEKFPAFDFCSDDEIIKERQPGEFIQTFVEDWPVRGTQKPVIVAYTNSSTKTYNEAVRKKLFPDTPDITDGDQIIIVKNNYNYERSLLNGQMGTVVTAAEETESRYVPLNVGVDDEGKKKIESIHLEFRNVTLRFMDDYGNPFDVTCMILETCLNNGEAQIPSEYSKALYVDFKQRNPSLKSKDPEFKEALKADPYFNAVMLKFGYAITCHKAQGGEWHTVFIDFSGQNKLNADGLRWSYTALTRAETAVVATNALHHQILKPTKQRTTPVVTTPAPPPTDREDVHLKTKEPDNLVAAGAAPSELTPTALIRQQIEHLLPEGWKIDSTRTLPYQEQVILSVGSNHVTASISYKGNHRISKIRIMPVQGQETVDQQAADFLASLKGLSLVLDQEAPEVMKAHQPFIDELKGKLAEEQLELVSLTSNTEFHLVARVRLGHEEGSVSYYFNGKEAFTRYAPYPDCPSPIIKRIQSIHG